MLCANNWRQPKGGAASKLKSEVRWDLANEIDVRALSASGDAIPSLDRELQSRLKDRAMMQKYVDQAAALVTEEG